MTTNGQRTFRVALVASWTFLVLAFAAIAVVTYWTVRPADLPTIDQPIPILNDNNTITVGEPIVMELRVNKPRPTQVIGSDRFIICESGNLITLTSTPSELPDGEFTIIADGAILTDNIIDGDVCTFLYRVDYQINPIRFETAEYESEPFTVKQAEVHE